MIDSNVTPTPPTPGAERGVGAEHRREGAAAMAALPDPPDAVFCFNGLLAVGALRTVAERGVRTPEDLAVVGFDDHRRTDKAAIAAAPVDLLLRRVENAGLPPERVQIRESTGG